jgi:ABC-2 type transport system permease protein
MKEVHMNTTKKNLADDLRIIWSIAAKDIVDALKNKTTLTIILGISMVMLSGQALPLILKLKPIPTAYVFDAGESALITELRRDRGVGVVPLRDETRIEISLGETNQAAIGLTIPEDFDQQVQEGGQVELVGYAPHWVSSIKVDELVAVFEDRFTELAGNTVSIHIGSNNVYPKPDSGGQPFMISMTFTLATIVIGGFLVPFLIIEEKEKHTMDVLLVSPASYTQVVLGKALAGAFYCLTTAGVVIAFNLGMVVHWWFALLTVLSGALFTVSLGLLMGTLFENPNNMNMVFGLIIIILLVPVFLSEAMSSNIPQVVRSMVPWMPSVALAKLYRITLSLNVPWEISLMNLGILLGFSVVFLALVVWRIKQLDR